MRGHTVKAIRLYNDKSQKAFAKVLGFSESAIAAVESGRNEPSQRLRAQIARHFPIGDEFINFLRDFEKINGYIQDNTIMN